jgi:hypothetical protein
VGETTAIPILAEKAPADLAEISDAIEDEIRGLVMSAEAFSGRGR